MTRVDFYVLSDQSEQSRLTYVCKLAEKAVRQSESVYIHTENPALAESLDEALWHFRDDSFVAHRAIPADGDDVSGIEPVGIGCGPTPNPERTVLINLGSDVPEFFSRFKRTLEVVNQDEQTRSSGRERYSFYRERGYPLKHHKV